MRRLNKYVKEKFDYDVSALSTYTTLHNKELLSEMLRAPKIMDYVALYENIKSGDFIPIMDTTANIKAASTCAWNPSGDLTFSDKTITTVWLDDQKEFCQKDLNSKWTKEFLVPGARSQKENFPFDAAFTAFYLKRVAIAIQNLILVGDTGGTDPIDGLFTRVYASGSVLNAALSGGLTNANALDHLLSIYETLPADVFEGEDQPVILVGRDWGLKAIRQNYNDNRFEYNVVMDADGGFTLPTTTVRVQTFTELNGTNQAVASNPRNLVVGTDLEDDMSEVYIRYADDIEKIKASVDFRLGTQILFDDQIVKATVGT